MILCHDLKLIFLKTKKTGGTSFEIALSKYCDEDDIISRISKEDEKVRSDMGFQEPVNYLPGQRLKYQELDSEVGRLNRQIVGRFKNHMSSQKVCQNVGEKIFSTYTKVTIHRDPLDFLISQYFYLMNARESEDVLSFKEWLGRNDNHRNVLVNFSIAPVEGSYAVDEILRYESLLADIEKSKTLPDDLAGVFSSLNAKGNLRDPRSRDVQEFFAEQGCEDYIPEIQSLVSLR